MQPVGVEREIRAHREDLLHLVVPAVRRRARTGVRAARGHPARRRARSPPRPRGPPRPASRRPAGARRRRRRARPASVSFDGERRWKSANGRRLVDPADPDVERSVPVAVAMDLAAGLASAGGPAVLVEDVERLVLRIGDRRGSLTLRVLAQNRSSTCSRAPSAISCSVSSLRPGRTSRWTTPSSASRYWPTQSSRGE